jgi:hypothetical protein
LGVDLMNFFIQILFVFAVVVLFDRWRSGVWMFSRWLPWNQRKAASMLADMEWVHVCDESFKPIAFCRFEGRITEGEYLNTVALVGLIKKTAFAAELLEALKQHDQFIDVDGEWVMGRILCVPEGSNELMLQPEKDAPMINWLRSEIAIHGGRANMPRLVRYSHAIDHITGAESVNEFERQWQQAQLVKHSQSTTHKQ